MNCGLHLLTKKGGWAAMARIDMTLADLGTFTGSITKHTTGFGTFEQRVNEPFIVMIIPSFVCQLTWN
jgi:cell surface protein SprA